MVQSWEAVRLARLVHVIELLRFELMNSDRPPVDGALGGTLGHALHTVGKGPARTFFQWANVLPYGGA